MLNLHGLVSLAALPLLLVACTPSAPSQACLTRADCAGTELCVAGRCVAAAADAGSSESDAAPDRDSARGQDSDVDAASDRDAYADDAPQPDAFVTPDAGPPAGESCANPIRLPLDAVGRAHFEGDLAAYRHDHAIYCGPDVGPDVIFVVDIGDDRRDIEITTSGDAATDTMVSFSEDCAGDRSGFYSCQDDRAPGRQDTRMILRRYGARQLFVMVRGFDVLDVGAFVLDVAVGAVADTSHCATTPIDLTGGAFVVGWRTASDAAPYPSCVAPGPLVSDVYRLRRDGQTTIDYINAYFGGVQGAIAGVDSCTTPVTESYCALSTLTPSGYYGIDASTLPLPTPELGYLVVSAPDASSSYSFTVYP